MNRSSLPHVRLCAVYSAVPEKEIAIEDELEYYDNSLKKADRARAMIGMDKRRIAWPDLTAADLCKAAAERLLCDAQANRSEIDALIFVSQTPDYSFPATACILQNELGLPHSCAAFDVNQGCSGYVYGLWMAAGLLSSGACSSVLLLAGDAHYRQRDPRNRIIAPIFGDGGSATLLRRVDNAPAAHFSVGTDGAGYKHIIMPGGGSRIPYSRLPEENAVMFEDIAGPLGEPWRLNEMYMNGPAVFEFTMNVVPAHIKHLLERASTPLESIDLFLPHQANKQIVKALAAKVGIPAEKTVNTVFGRYGNLSSASIPAAFCEAYGDRGTSGRQKLLLSGFGVGLSWASCIIDVEDAVCAPVLDVRAPDQAPDRRERIADWMTVLAAKEE